MKDLQEDFMGGAEIRISDPVVSFRETVNQMSDHIVMSKSPNKHNRCVSALQVPILCKFVLLGFHHCGWVTVHCEAWEAHVQNTVFWVQTEVKQWSRCKQHHTSI